VPQSANVAVTIGSAPIVYGVLNQYNSSTIHANDIIQVFGTGFSVTPQNVIQLVRPGFSDVWLWDADGSYFWDRSYIQMNASLNNWAVPGAWTLYVYNGYTGNSSAGYPITINP